MQTQVRRFHLRTVTAMSLTFLAGFLASALMSTIPARAETKKAQESRAIELALDQAETSLEVDQVAGAKGVLLPPIFEVGSRVRRADSTNPLLIRAVQGNWILVSEVDDPQSESAWLYLPASPSPWFTVE